jgi:hypothetical protein
VYSTSCKSAASLYAIVKAGHEYIVLRNPWGWKDGTFTADGSV